MTAKEELKAILRRLKNEGDAARIKAEAGEFLKKVDAATLSLAEQELLQEGFTQEDLMRLCDVHLAVLGGSLEEQKPRQNLDHPVGIFMVEHEIILKNLEELGRIVTRLGKAKGYTETGDDVRRLGEISTLLLETESHHQREEQALFPRLEKAGVTGPPRIMRLEHDELRARKKKLARLVKDAGTLDFAEFMRGVRDAGGYLAVNLTSHIFKEDNILYPTALQTLQAGEWQEVQREFDKIGYCTFTPVR